MARACLTLMLLVAASAAAAQNAPLPQPLPLPSATKPGHQAGRPARDPARFRFYGTAGGFAGSLRNPFLREPAPENSSSSELQTRQVVDVRGGRLGVGLRNDRWGGEVAVSYWPSVDLIDFDYFNPTGSAGPDSTTYGDVSVGLWQVDLVLLGAPVRRVPLWGYVLLGMGMGSKQYTVSGHSDSFLNGRRELSEFNYTPGIGLRITPIRQVSLFGEVRWVPGDRTTTIPQEGCYITYRVPARLAGPLNPRLNGGQAVQIEECETNTDYGQLFSIGATINLP